MANENETVEQVCELIRRAARVQNADDPRAVIALANRILAAHKREIAERDGERKGILRANESFAADNTRLRGEIAEKDAEIASLKDKNTEAFKAVLKRDALIRELADALKKIDDACDGDMCKHFIDTEQCSKCKYLETCQTGIAHNALKANESEIAKALEGCK